MHFTVYIKINIIIKLIFFLSRFLNTEWSGCQAWDMMQIYNSVPFEEKKRVESLEFLDEQELLTQLLQHYAICIAWKGEHFKNIKII